MTRKEELQILKNQLKKDILKYANKLDTFGDLYFGYVKKAVDDYDKYMKELESYEKK